MPDLDWTGYKNEALRTRDEESDPLEELRKRRCVKEMRLPMRQHRQPKLNEETKEIITQWKRH